MGRALDCAPDFRGRLRDAGRHPGASLSEVDRSLGENAVTGDGSSVLSHQILARLGLSTLYEDDPRAALERLRSGLGGPDEHERLLALAELWYATARKSDDRGEYLAAVCAYAYLFPAASLSAPLDPYDARAHFVLEIYDHGIAQGLALTRSSHGTQLDLSRRRVQLPFGTFVLSVPEEEFRYGGYRIVHPAALGDLEIRGLRNRYWRPGAGVALATSIEPTKDGHGDPWLPPWSKVPVTAFVRLEELAADLSRVRCTIELYDADETRAIPVGSATVPPTSDPSAAFAYRLDGAPIWDFEIAGFRRSDLRLPGVSRTHGLGFLYPHRPGRIPVVLVHGTLSSPARSAAELREALQKAQRDLDPEGKDPALRRMVVVGHSQGGLITKAMVVSSGNAFWAAWTDRKFEDVPMSPKARALVASRAFFEPLPFVTRVIFIATPHRGSFPTELFATIFQQNWENVRGIKSERIWFMNTYSVISAGSLSLLQGVHGERVIQLTLIAGLCLLSVIGFISSLRLKAELEECLAKIQTMVTRTHADELVALGRPEAVRYPAFRWVFPIFYFAGTALFVGLLVSQLASGARS